MKDERYKEIMHDLGMPQSKSLHSALLQVANEVAQEIHAIRKNDTDKTEFRNKQFKDALMDLLNGYSIENECDMPDFLLAEMIVNFIQAVGKPIKQTLDWHGCDSICHPKETP